MVTSGRLRPGLERNHVRAMYPYSFSHMMAIIAK